MNTITNNKTRLHPAFLACLLLLCSIAAYAADSYSISGTAILKNGSPVTLSGANAMHVFDGSDPLAMSTAGAKIVREFVGNMQETPVATPRVIKDSHGKYLRSLQMLVDNNRKRGLVTIFCPFMWDFTSATRFSGKNPKAQSFYPDYTKKMAEWAQQFKGQSDVWIEVWNEPYRWDRSNGYSDDRWLSDMTEIVDNIRAAGFDGIIVVPGAEQGQDEKVLLAKGQALLHGRANILFDVHAYEKWLKVPQAAVEARLQQLQQAGLPVIFGEVGPKNAGPAVDPTPFLNATWKNQLGVLAWIWQRSTDPDALFDPDGKVNDTNNFNWGTTFFKYLSGKWMGDPVVGQ